jgi:YYY domain-containing protein
MLQTLSIACYWYLVFVCFGLIVLPLSMLVFRRMPENGILLSRPLGWLLLTSLSWLTAYLGLPFTRFGIVFIGILLFAGSSYIAYTKGTWILRRLKSGWRTALNGEIITILVFLLILFVRFRDPNVDHTEKPMDVMMLNSLVESTRIPPQDAWFAGHGINYHYGGYLLHSIPVKLSGIPSEYGYNLAVATVAAIGASIAFCLGRALFGKCRRAVMTVICTLFIGNLVGFMEMFSGGHIRGSLHEWRFGFLWKTSRVIQDSNGETINEYPFFSIMWADLHPHFSNIPFFLFFLALCYVIYRSVIHFDFKQMLRYEWLLLVTIVLSGALLFPTNIFDFPIGSLLYGCVIMAAIIQSCLVRTVDWKSALRKLPIVALPLLSYLIAFPFWLHFESPLPGFPVRVSTEHSDFIEFFMVFGAHIVASIVFIVMHLLVLLEKHDKEEIGFLFGILGMVFIAIWAWYGFFIAAFTPVLALVFWILSLYTSFTPEPEKHSHHPLLYAMLACAIAWTLIAGCEFFYLKDSYGVARMNTLFKFHFPAWILLGVGLPVLLYRAFKQQTNKQILAVAALPTALVFLLSIAGPIYALGGIYTMPSHLRASTINSMAFLERNNPLASQIIQWLRDNTQPSDRILEPAGSAYCLENIISAASGRATLVGWENHERLWRPAMFAYNNPQAIGNVRSRDTFTFFTTPNWNDAKRILDEYKIQYVVYFPPINKDIRTKLSNTRAAAFRQNLEPIIQGRGDGTTPELYRVPQEQVQEP